MNVGDAIQASNVNVADIEVFEEKTFLNPELITPIPLPSLFK